MSLNERVQEEIEALEAILMNDISITYSDPENLCPEVVKSTILPSTADDPDKQYVCVTLEVKLPDGYPDCEPLVQLRNPRGLDDTTLNHLQKAIKEKCQEFLGQPVIYELIELIRESLTESNLPTCHCAVCLYDFSEGDSFTKTSCFHYFHSYCLAMHSITTEKHFKEEQEKLPTWQKSTMGFQATCPVCREAISCDAQELKTALPPRELEKAQHFEVTKELQMLQAKMRELFIYQKSRGGIIDIEAEENKLLLITQSGDSPGDDPGPSLSHDNNAVLSRNQRFETQRSTPTSGR